MENIFFLHTLSIFLSQWLVHLDHTYTEEAVSCALQQEQERLFSLFCMRFHLERRDDPAYNALFTSWLPEDMIVNLAKQAIHSIVKTNYFFDIRAKGFRFDAHFYHSLPEQLKKATFHQCYYGLFYFLSSQQGNPFFGFHIRFQDIARGGLRSVLVPKRKQNILLECYDLAWTQEKKNKDIAEGGAKGVLYIDITPIVSTVEVKERLHEAQKEFTKSLLNLVNGSESGELREKEMIDYYKKPEYIYLGPDENMHDSMIEWISSYSKAIGYKPALAFITGKITAGINHKKYGVTSYGLTVCLEKVLEYLGLQDKPFSVKMKGGPDGDVAGNEILNLYKMAPMQVKLVAITDVSGTLVDPQGLDLAALCALFYAEMNVSHYSRDLLSPQGYKLMQVDQGFVMMTKTKSESLSEERARDINEHAVHEIEADIFIPAGGRPNSLDEKSIAFFFNKNGEPTAKAIIEGANVYLTQKARDLLEARGALIIKDSSANKGGVISSSYEVLASLVLSEDEFVMLKEQLALEILHKIKQFASQEASLILDVHIREKKHCSHISNEISNRILDITEQVLEWLADKPMPEDSEDPLYRPFFAYCLPILVSSFRDRLMTNIAENHKKAIISTYLASQMVYTNYIALPKNVIPLLSDYIQQFKC